MAVTYGDRLGIGKSLQFQDLLVDGKFLKLCLN